VREVGQAEDDNTLDKPHVWHFLPEYAIVTHANKLPALRGADDLQTGRRLLVHGNAAPFAHARHG
jgi:hypothetical protein